MIFDASALPLPMHIDADVCVVGSGPGGSGVAATAAEAGLRVVVLETGAFVPPASMTQREEEMIPALLWANGGMTTNDRGVHVHQGRAVGGSAVHNINLCKRIPKPILDEWARTNGLEHLDAATWNALYDEVEALLQVSSVPEDRWNRHNVLLREGCETLGWRGGGLSHNRTGCIGSGFCLLGCAYDAKNNAAKILIPRAVRAGADILSHCRATEILHDGTTAIGVRAVALDPVHRRPIGTVDVKAPRVCVSGSATGTPALLLRSGVPDPSRNTGDTLRIHPALVAAGEYDEPVRAWMGIPQTYECTEHLDFAAAHDPEMQGRVGARTWIVPAFAFPVGTATLLPGHGRVHREAMERFPRLGVLTCMIHDRTAGSVRARGALDVSLDYWPDEDDRKELVFGLVACVRLLFASGARKVYVPTDPVTMLEPGDSLAELERLELTKGLLDITAVHPMGSVPMADDPKLGPVDSRGAHHGLAGLWVADGSLFPTSIGVPPQVSIYAMGLHVGRAIAATA